MVKSKALFAAAVIAAGMAAGMAAGIAVSCSGSKKQEERVALIVNGEKITREQVDEAAEFFRRQQMMISPEKTFDAAEDTELRRGAARQLAANMLMAGAVKAMGWTADPARVEALVERFISQFPDREAFMAQLAAMGESLESMREGMAEEMLLDSLVSMVSNQADTVGDSEVSAFYEENKSRYVAPQRARASHIIFSLSMEDDTSKVRETMEKSMQALAKAKAGEDFDELIKQYSSQPKYGDMGWFSKGDLIPELETVIFSLKKGGVSELVPSSMGMHIIKKTDEEEPRPMKFEEAAQSIKTSLEFSKKGKRVNDYVDSLLAAADIVYVDTALIPQARPIENFGRDALIGNSMPAPPPTGTAEATSATPR
jgi:parvulin-like peptidyl-prolyl isomerase